MTHQEVLRHKLSLVMYGAALGSNLHQAVTITSMMQRLAAVTAALCFILAACFHPLPRQDPTT